MTSLGHGRPLALVLARPFPPLPPLMSPLPVWLQFCCSFAALAARGTSQLVGELGSEAVHVYARPAASTVSATTVSMASTRVSGALPS